MDKQQKRVRVNRTTDQRSPQSVRGLGRALIALAQAQLEAEAQAEAEAKADPDHRPPRAKPASEQSNGSTGDAA